MSTLDRMLEPYPAPSLSPYQDETGPFRYVDQTKPPKIQLEVRATGETFQVKEYIGHALLALGGGMANEKTSEELLDHIDPQREKSVDVS